MPAKALQCEKCTRKMTNDEWCILISSIRFPNSETKWVPWNEISHSFSVWGRRFRLTAIHESQQKVASRMEQSQNLFLENAHKLCQMLMLIWFFLLFLCIERSLPFTNHTIYVIAIGSIYGSPNESTAHDIYTCVVSPYASEKRKAMQTRTHKWRNDQTKRIKFDRRWLARHMFSWCGRPQWSVSSSSSSAGFQSIKMVKTNIEHQFREIPPFSRWREKVNETHTNTTSP